MLLTYTTDSDTLNLDDIRQAADFFLQDYSLDTAQQLEIAVHFVNHQKNLSCVKKGNSCTITCREPAHFFKALNMILHHPKENFHIEEMPSFAKNGFMLDCSRNAVASVPAVKKLIHILARAGMNQLLLYTEDTYEVPNLPYFGAYRGRYTKEELRELDTYAHNFGIELVPCIQTLAHLRNYLKWPQADPLKDNADILKVGSPQVYDFIRQILTSLKDCFQTRNIHIGMDEAVFLGLGNYLKENGYCDSSQLIQEHSAKVLEICRGLGWTPMMWSDMYITSNTKKGYYAVNEQTDTSSWKKPDSDLGLVYWDYYNWNQKVYENMLRVHKELSNRTVFAAGVWNWNGIAPNYTKAITCTSKGLLACQNQGIQEVFTTGWMDNGAETPLEAIYPGLLAFSYLCFHKELSLPDFARFFADCTDASLDSFMLLDEFDSLFQGKEQNLATDNPSKYLLYQDVMLGMFDYHLQGVNTQTYYNNLAKKLEEAMPTVKKYHSLFEFYHALALVLADKADLGICLKKVYDSKDLSTMKEISEKVIPRLLENLQTMHMVREKLWMKDAKPFGYELLDIKLGGVATRLKSCQRRINNYLQGNLSHLEELEQERLPYWEAKASYPHPQDLPLRENLWNRIISGCDLIDTI